MIPRTASIIYQSLYRVRLKANKHFVKWPFATGHLTTQRTSGAIIVTVLNLCYFDFRHYFVSIFGDFHEVKSKQVA